MTRDGEARRHELHMARLDARAARARRVVDMWPRMSIRDIAVELDVTTGTIVSDALRLGLPSRPVSVAPGQGPRARYTPPQSRRG